MKIIPAVSALLFVIFINTPLSMANTLTVTPNPDGSVMMAADYGVEGVARIDLTFSFASDFKSPRLIVQGGDVSIVQSTDGYLHLDIVREGEEMQQAAFVLIADFDVMPEDRPCTVNFVVASYYYADGRTGTPQVIVLPPIVQKKKEDEPENDEAAAATAATPATDWGNPPGDVVKRSLPIVSAEPGANGQSASGAGMDLLEFRECPDILQRFRDYRGERSFSSLLSLFNFGNPCGYEQFPAVAVSDGATRVVVNIEVEDARANPPNLGMSGAALLSMRSSSDSSWSIELLPNPGEHGVVLFVITGGELKRIPLVVAPPLADYMKTQPPEEKLTPLFEYVLAVNYLASHGETAAK